MSLIAVGVKPTCDRVQVASNLFSLPSKNPPCWISPAQPEHCLPAAGRPPSPPDDEPLRPTGPPSPGTSGPPQSSTPHSTVGSGSAEPPPPSLLSREPSERHPRFGWKISVPVQGGEGVHCAAGSRGLRGVEPGTSSAQLSGLPPAATPSIPSSYLPHLSTEFSPSFHWSFL